MSNEFTEKYFQPCVREFVSTVLLIDDQLEYGKSPTLPSGENETLIIPTQGTVMPHVEDETVEFSLSSDDGKRKVYVTDLIKTFSKEKLLVTPINPNEIVAKNRTECIEILTGLAEKADVIILDWDMNVSFSDGTKFSPNELSQKLIEKLNSDNKYRLVMIYTADTKQSVKGKLSVSDNIGVRIYGKTNTTGTDVKDYDELAKQVNIDFLEEKKGLLGSALLTSLTALRKSTYSMLNTLNSDHDEALLYHRILLTNPEKVTDFCTELIQDELLSHISSETVKIDLQLDVFKNYINEKNIKFRFKSGETGERKEVENDEWDNLLKFGYKSFFDDDIASLIAKGKHLDYIIQDSDLNKLKAFSYYSSMISSDIKPNLKLGCIVKLGDNYYLCIQPLCDTERIPRKGDIKDNNPPNFLFLSIIKNSQMDFFIKSGDNFIGMRVDYSSTTVMPVFGNEDGVVPLCDNKYMLYDDKQLEYVACLKPMFAQKIANNFAANISRVGIDQFEWLRLKGRE